MDGLVSGVPISGEFQATGLQDDLRLTGVLTSGDFDATPLLDQFETVSKDQFPVELLSSAQVSARFEHMQDVLRIRDFEASAGDLEMNGDFQIANPSGSGVFSGWLQTNPFDPVPWARAFGITPKESTVMRLAQVSADVRQSGPVSYTHLTLPTILLV